MLTKGAAPLHGYKFRPFAAVLFHVRSVTEGHANKICDAISDGVLDGLLKDDPKARVACETATTTGLVLIIGEITTTAYADLAGIARETIRRIGYTNPEYGFNANGGRADLH